MGGIIDADEIAGWERQREEEMHRERLRQPEAEIERMRPIVDAALNWNRTDYRNLDECEEALEAISDACDAYVEAGDGN